MDSYALKFKVKARGGESRLLDDFKRTLSQFLGAASTAWVVASISEALRVCVDNAVARGDIEPPVSKVLVLAYGTRVSVVRRPESIEEAAELWTELREMHPQHEWCAIINALQVQAPEFFTGSEWLSGLYS